MRPESSTNKAAWREIFTVLPPQGRHEKAPSVDSAFSSYRLCIVGPGRRGRLTFFSRGRAFTAMRRSKNFAYEAAYRFCPFLRVPFERIDAASSAMTSTASACISTAAAMQTTATVSAAQSPAESQRRIRGRKPDIRAPCDAPADAGAHRPQTHRPPPCAGICSPGAVRPARQPA